jgi:hypothetical protein
MSSTTLRLLSCIIGAFIIISFFRSSLPVPHALHLPQREAHPTHNATLGFGAIVLISLPERTDRRDGVSLLTSFSGVRITHTVDAVKGADVVKKARPYGQARDKLDDGYFGSWRSHMDALKYIVDNRIESALLIEDDVDW